MKKFALVVALAMIAGSAAAATVVLKGGKHIEVERWSQEGNLIVLHHANGRVEGYPLTAVDLDATRAAVPKPEPTEAAKEVGSRSPFGKARSAPAGSGVTITDAEVGKFNAPEETPEAEGVKPDEDPSGQVTLVSYDLKPAEEGRWTVTATVSNSGGVPVQNLSVVVKPMDAEGKLLGTGTAPLSGVLEPGKTGTVTATVTAPARPAQVAFDLNWQVFKPIVRPTVPAATTPAPSTT